MVQEHGRKVQKKHKRTAAGCFYVLFLLSSQNNTEHPFLKIPDNVIPL
jgi:hypothetical protein